MHLKPVNQQVVVIMGASSGIGRATALRFAARGARVVVAARSQVGLASLVQEIESRGGAAIGVVAEVTDVEQVKHVAERAVAEYGRIDTWVHVAAVAVQAPFEQTLPDELARVIAVNLLGAMFGAQAALPYLRLEGRGALIEVSSAMAMVSLPFQSAYAASKAGMRAFLDSLRLELMHADVPVSVTNIMPSSMNTPIFNKMLTRLGVMARGVPPMYEPEIVADAIVNAAEHPSRDIVVGGAAMAMLLLNRISPLISDAILLTRIGFEGQMTRVPRSPDAPNDLFEPTQPRYTKVAGDFGAESWPASPATRLATSSLARAAEAAVSVGAAIFARFVELGWFITLPPAARQSMMRRMPSTPQPASGATQEAPEAPPASEATKSTGKRRARRGRASRA